MNNKILTLMAVSILAVGCASVPMESAEKTANLKQFSVPSDGKSGLYIYRYGTFGAAIKKDVWVDGECLGQTAPNVFFYTEVDGNNEHKISTESEFSPNDLSFQAEIGKNYFINQYIKLGLVSGGAGLKLVDEEEGKEKIKGLGLASKGPCSTPLKTEDKK